jgi:hypothetical protein
MSFLERISEKNVGFHCWKLFVINYFRGYEVSFDKNLIIGSKKTLNLLLNLKFKVISIFQ